MNAREIENLKTLRKHLEGAWWACEWEDMLDEINNLIDRVDGKLKEGEE